MATHPGAAHGFLYAYRIAVPWLVHALPFSQAVALQLLVLLGIAASGAALYVLLRELDVQPRLASALAVGFPDSVACASRRRRSPQQ